MSKPFPIYVKLATNNGELPLSTEGFNNMEYACIYIAEGILPTLAPGDVISVVGPEDC